MINTLGLQAYEELRRMLLQGRLEPGMQLVNRKLADEIGMSMTPVREAVTRLASEGMVEYVAGAGAFVRRISRLELSQLYDVRLAIEPMAAAEAARHATSAEIAELRAVAADSFAIIRGIAAARHSHATAVQMARWIEDEQRFHEVIFQAARNCWLAKIASDMKLLAFGFTPQRRMPEMLTVSAAVRTWRGHRRLIRALAGRDATLASTITAEHVAEGKEDVLAHFLPDRSAENGEPVAEGLTGGDPAPSRQVRQTRSKKSDRSRRASASPRGRAKAARAR